MKKIFDRTTILSTIVTLLPIIPALFLYNRIPEVVAIHFDAQGRADGWASRPFAVFALPSLLAVLNIVMQLALLSDPKRDVQSKIFYLARWSIAPISLLVNTITLLIALSIPIPIERIVPFAIAILSLVIGNYLPKCKQNYTIGIKLPWTLASEQNWNKTHRLAGWVWTIGSLILLISTIVGLPSFVLFIVVSSLMVLIPIVYSYLYYQKYESKNNN
jgi:uncharacterized membrane protein